MRSHTDLDRHRRHRRGTANVEYLVDLVNRRQKPLRRPPEHVKNHSQWNERQLQPAQIVVDVVLE